MSNIIVLGAGMVGSAMAFDLAKKHQVTVADLSETALSNIKSKNSKINTNLLNVTDKTQLTNTLQPFDLVICAVPGFLGYQTLESIIEAGKNVVDISFFPENALDLVELAKEKNVTAIVDCGVAPGMGNILLGYHNETMKVEQFECLVGGLPKVKKWPFCYKAPFSPIDVIEEYTRPARYVENFKMVTRPALSDCEYIEFENAGTLESFNTDGLRSLIFTMPHIPYMKEKTLRYPGHVEYIKVLKESGFFNEEKISLADGTKISPMEFTAKILINEWKLGESESEITVMRISIEGENKNGQKEKITYDLYDEYNAESKTSSMARTTGYTATAAANLLLDGHFEEKGVFPPELIGKHAHCFDYIYNYLKDRGVVYHKKSVLL
jgi:saccharopine dehydrogenase-like NADP-dependent oxidoreductase